MNCWFRKRTEGPLKTASRCHFHILSLIFFFSSIIQAGLINRYDCRACNLCARDLFCCGSGWRGGALAGIVSFLFHDGQCFGSAATDIIILSQREIWHLFFLLYVLTFLWLRMTCSKVIVCCACIEKVACGCIRSFFKMSLLHDVSHWEQNK